MGGGLQNAPDLLDGGEGAALPSAPLTGEQLRLLADFGAAIPPVAPIPQQPQEAPGARSRRLRAEFRADPAAKGFRIIGTTPDGDLRTVSPQGEVLIYRTRR